MPFWCGLKPLTALPLLCRAGCAAAVGRAADGRRTHRVTVVGSVAGGLLPEALPMQGFSCVQKPPEPGGYEAESPCPHPLS